MDDHLNLYNLVARTTNISYDQMMAAASAISRQPKDDWALLRSALGLDGVPIRLNNQAKHRYFKEQAALADS